MERCSKALFPVPQVKECALIQGTEIALLVKLLFLVMTFKLDKKGN